MNQNEPDRPHPILVLSVVLAFLVVAVFMLAASAATPPVSHSEQGGPEVVSHWPVDPAPTVYVIPITGLGFVVGSPGDWVFVELDGLEGAVNDATGDGNPPCNIVETITNCDDGLIHRWMSTDSFLAIAACMDAGWAMCAPDYDVYIGLEQPFFPCMDTGCSIGEWTWFEFSACDAFAGSEGQECSWIEFDYLLDCRPECY